MPIVEYEAGEPVPRSDRPHGRESSPAWPAPPRARRAPRTSSSSCSTTSATGSMSAFGGLVETPTLDRLAANGLRYTNMHTAALCSPLALLHPHGPQPPLEPHLGHHRGRDRLSRRRRADAVRERDDLGDPRAAGLQHLHHRQVARRARPRTARRPGPIDRWPLGRGFERFYGWLGCESSSWYPELVYDNHPVEAAKTPEEGYHLDEDTVDHAIRFILDAHVNAPDKPFLLYHASAAGKSPHHSPPRVDREVQRQVRHGLGRVPAHRLRASEGDGDRPGRHRAAAARPRRPGVGQPERRPASASTPA